MRPHASTRRSLLPPALAVAVLALLAGTAEAQISKRQPVPQLAWEQLGPLVGAGPEVAYLTGSAIAPHEVFATSHAGLLRSSDGGANWIVQAEMPEGFGTHTVPTLSPLDPDHIVLFDYQHGVRRSEDGGATWTLPEQPPVGDFYLTATQDPVDPQTVFCGLETGVWRSDDGGLSFSLVLDVLPTTSTSARYILIDVNDRLRVYAFVSGDGLYVSHDGGDTWTQRAFPPGVTLPLSAAIDPNDGRRLLAGQQEVWLSEDEGETWTPLGIPYIGVDALAFDAVDPLRFYATQRYIGLSITDDGGLTWTPCTDPGLDRMGSNPRAIRVSLAHPGEILVAGRGGFARSTDSGATFERTNAGLEAHAQVYSLAVDAGDPDHLVARTGGSLFVSLDAGSTWTESNMPPGCVGYDVLADAAIPGRFYVPRLGNTQAELWRSDDGGFHFYVVNQTANLYAWHMKAHPSLPDVIYGAGSGLQRSDDGGVTFVNTGLPLGWVWDVAISPTDPDVIYATGNNIHFSHDGGATWSTPATPPTQIVRDLEVDPVDPLRAWASNPFQGLFRTDDGGVNWVQVSPEVLGAQSTHCPPAWPDLLLISDFFTSGVRASYTGGTSSFAFDTGLKSLVLSFQSSATRIWAASGGHGVFELR